MPLTLGERIGSRDLTRDNKGPTAQFLYYAYRSFNELEVYNAVLAAAPLVYEGLVKRKCHVQHQGGGFWHGDVDYEWPEGVALVGQGIPGGGTGAGEGAQPPPDSSGTPSETQPLGVEFNFDTAGGTAHAVMSKNTVAKKGRGGIVVPDNKRAIGWTRDGKIEGTDIVAPKLEFSFSRKIASVSLLYIKRLRSTVGKMNDAPFLTFDVGELLFLGASGQYRDQEGWQVSFKFAAAENEAVVELVPGADGLKLLPADRTDGIVTVAKLGWEYVWVGFRDSIDAAAAVSLPLADYAYLERLYDFANFPVQLGWGA